MTMTCTGCGATVVANDRPCAACGTAQPRVPAYSGAQGPAWPASMRPVVPLPPVKPVVLSSALSGFLQLFLWLTALVAAFGAFVEGNALATFNTFWDTRTRAAADRWTSADNLVPGTFVILAVVWVLTFCVLVTWTYKAHKASSGLQPVGRSWARGWAIGGWFIPLANLVIPKSVLNEIERIATAPRREGRVISGWRNQHTSTVGWVWWIALYTGFALNRVSVVIVNRLGPDEVGPSDFRASYIIGTISFVLVACAAMLAAIHLGSIGHRLGRKAWVRPRA